MKVVINNYRFGVILTIVLLCLPFVSAFFPRHKILYNLSQYESYVPPHFGVDDARCVNNKGETRIHRGERAAFLESMGISRGELWLSRIRFLILLYTSFFIALSTITYVNRLLEGKIKFVTEVDIKMPFKTETEQERLERLGRKLLSLPLDEQEELMNRMKDNSTSIVRYEAEEVPSYNSKSWIS